MQEAQNTQVVRTAYAAFLRGDAQAVLDTLHDDVVWKPVNGVGSQVPFGGVRRGKAAVGEFFRILSETEVFEQFEPREFVAQGDKVVALGHYCARTKALGRTFESDWAMVFTVRDGKIAEFNEFTDSAGINAAFSPVAATV